MTTNPFSPAEQTRPTPRPTSYTGRVYHYVKDGCPRSAIERETGLSGMRLTDAIRSNYRLGYLQTPLLEERRRRLRLNTSAGKGGVWLAIRDYAPLYLTARQTQVAIRHYQGRRLSLEQIATAYGRERRRNQLARPAAELAIEAQRDKRRTERALLEIVRLRLAVDAFLTERGMEKLLTLGDRINLSFAERLSELGLVTRNYTEWLLLLHLYERHGKSPIKKWLWAHKETERRFIKECRDQDAQLLASLFEQDPVNMPTTAWAQSHLLDFYHGLEVFVGTGDAALLHGFPEVSSQLMERSVRQVAERRGERRSRFGSSVAACSPPSPI